MLEEHYTLDIEQLKVKNKVSKTIIESKLEQHANDWLRANYNMTLDIPIQLNSRLKRTYGQFLAIADKPVRIEIKTQYVQACFLTGNSNVVFDTLHHELTHYAMMMLGKNYDDGSQDFEEALARTDTRSSATTPKYLVRGRYGRQCKIKALYKCDCGQEHIVANGLTKRSYETYITCPNLHTQVKAFYTGKCNINFYDYNG